MKLSKAFFIAAVLFKTCLGLADVATSRPEVCRAVMNQVRAGDLIFIAIDNVLFSKVAAATLSWTSHVGIVLPDERGKLVLYESNIPFSKTTPICKFVGHAGHGQYAIRRWQGSLTATDVERMRLAALTRLGVLYDFSFDLNSKKQFCSRFVAEIYREGIGLQIGHVETFRELLRRNPNPELIQFWQNWFRWATLFQGSIPLDAATLTPASVLQDPNFITVMQNGI